MKATSLTIMFFCLLVLVQCRDTCDCGSWEEGQLLDYTLSESSEQFKVCFRNAKSFKKDGVFFYTNPSDYQLSDCRRKIKIENEVPAVNDSYHTIIYVDNRTLHVTHRKTGSFNGRYCGKSSGLSCDFVISYENLYHNNGTTDSVYTMVYPRVTKATIQRYLKNFDTALKNALKNKDFNEDPETMKGFDYYGHAEDLLIGALNGDKIAEEKFRDYDDLTEDIVSRKVYSTYDDDRFDEQRNKEFFAEGIALIEETAAFKEFTNQP
jgi:hypothetical protein